MEHNPRLEIVALPRGGRGGGGRCGGRGRLGLEQPGLFGAGARRRRGPPAFRAPLPQQDGAEAGGAADAAAAARERGGRGPGGRRRRRGGDEDGRGLCRRGRGRRRRRPGTHLVGGRAEAGRVVRQPLHQLREQVLQPPDALRHVLHLVARVRLHVEDGGDDVALRQRARLLSQPVVVRLAGDARRHLALDRQRALKVRARGVQQPVPLRRLPLEQPALAALRAARVRLAGLVDRVLPRQRRRRRCQLLRFREHLRRPGKASRLALRGPAEAGAE